MELKKKVQQYFQGNNQDKLLWRDSIRKGNKTPSLQYHRNANGAEKSDKVYCYCFIAELKGAMSSLEPH